MCHFYTCLCHFFLFFILLAAFVFWITAKSESRPCIRKHRDPSPFNLDRNNRYSNGFSSQYYNDSCNPNSLRIITGKSRLFLSEVKLASLLPFSRSLRTICQDQPNIFPSLRLASHRRDVQFWSSTPQPRLYGRDSMRNTRGCSKDIFPHQIARLSSQSFNNTCVNIRHIYTKASAACQLPGRTLDHVKINENYES